MNQPTSRACAIFTLLFLPLVSSCVVPDDTSSIAKEHRTVAAARTEMIDLSEAELRMCAGFPNATANMKEEGQIWTYQRTVPRGNLNVALPTSAFGVLPPLGGSVNLSPGGYCHTQVRLQNGRVAEVSFAGDNNEPGSINSLCVASVDGCVNYARRKNGQLR